MQQLVEGERGALDDDITALPEGVEQLHETVDVGVPLEQAPVEPADLVVLAVGVVVAVLRAAHLVAHEQHRRAGRQQFEHKEVLDLAIAQRLDGASSVGPSTPQFQLRLSSAPSRLSSPFASLCLRS